eukprot:gene20885-27730_t
MAGRVAVLVASVVGTTPGTYSGRNMLQTEDKEDIARPLPPLVNLFSTSFNLCRPLPPLVNLFSTSFNLCRPLPPLVNLFSTSFNLCRPLPPLVNLFSTSFNLCRPLPPLVNLFSTSFNLCRPLPPLVNLFSTSFNLCLCHRSSTSSHPLLTLSAFATLVNLFSTSLPSAFANARQPLLNLRHPFSNFARSNAYYLANVHNKK